MTDCVLSPGFHASLILSGLGETVVQGQTCATLTHTFAGFLRYIL